MRDAVIVRGCGLGDRWNGFGWALAGAAVRAVESLVCGGLVWVW